MKGADPKSFLWSNLCALMGEDEPPLDRVVARTGVGRGTVQRIKEGETSVGINVLAKIAKAFKLEPWQLLHESMGADATAAAVMARMMLVGGADGASPPPGYLRMPLLGEAAAGGGREVDDDSGEVVRQIDVLESWLRQTFPGNPAQLRLLTARGHSMPGVANDGDVLFVLPCTTFDLDGVYVISQNGLLRVKKVRLRLSDGQLSIESTDGSAPDLVPLTAVGETVLIQGRVVGAWGLKKL